MLLSTLHPCFVTAGCKDDQIFQTAEIFARTRRSTTFSAGSRYSHDQQACYTNRKKQYLKLNSVLHAAISSMVTVAEILKNSRLAVEQSKQHCCFLPVPLLAALWKLFLMQHLTCVNIIVQRSPQAWMLSTMMAGKGLFKSQKWKLFCANLKTLTKSWHNRHDNRQLLNLLHLLLPLQHN